MARYARRKRAETEAQGLLERVGYCGCGKVDVYQIASALGLPVREVPARTGLDGGLILRNGSYTIVVAEHHHRVRQRFTVAHELGHFTLHAQRQAGADFVDRTWDRSERASQGIDPEEIEANAFAAALLMPTKAVQDAFRDLAEDKFHDAVTFLAEDFDVSTTAMGYRLQNLGLMRPV